jgi:phosphotransferase system  glucose/maltose/N-acetylglucosamine-specific IIC component
MVVKKSEEEIYEEAKKRVEDKKGFYTHLIVYVLVNIFLVIIWAVTTPGGYPWFIWPIIGWGVGLVFHFFATFVFNRKTGWEERELEKEVQKLKREQSE